MILQKQENHYKHIYKTTISTGTKITHRNVQ
jgi:hypothetical protein